MIIKLFGSPSIHGPKYSIQLICRTHTLKDVIKLSGIGNVTETGIQPFFLATHCKSLLNMEPHYITKKMQFTAI